MTLERAGVPTALVCSDEFAPPARAELRACGMSGEPLVVIGQPLADNHTEEVARKAAAIIDELVSVLTGSAGMLAERYRTRFLKPADQSVEDFRQRSA